MRTYEVKPADGMYAVVKVDGSTETKVASYRHPEYADEMAANLNSLSGKEV